MPLERRTSRATTLGGSISPKTAKCSQVLYQLTRPQCARVLYITTLPLADARARLSEIVTDADATHERFEITRNGRQAAVLLGADDYEAMRETIAVLADSELATSVREGLPELSAGGGLTEQELADYLRQAGHLRG